MNINDLFSSDTLLETIMVLVQVRIQLLFNTYSDDQDN